MEDDSDGGGNVPPRDPGGQDGEEMVRNSVDSPDFIQENLRLDINIPNENESDSEMSDNEEDHVANEFVSEEEEPPEDESDEELEEEIPIQPRIRIGHLLLGPLGSRNRDDSSDDSDAERDEGEGERFDPSLPCQHSYLGQGRQVKGHSLEDTDDQVVTLPLLPQPGLALLPDQLLPLHLFHPALVSMVRDLCDGPGASRTFGVLGGNHEGEMGGLAGSLGTTAQIFEVHDPERDQEDRNSNDVGLKLKARGRQRFRLLSVRRTTGGILMGEVAILQDTKLGDPLWGIRLKGLDRTCLSTQEKEGNTQVEKDSPQEKSKKFGCFGFLPSFGSLPVSNLSEESSVPFSPVRAGFRHSVYSKALSPLPPWVWDLYSPSCLSTRLRAELIKLNIKPPHLEPEKLAWWSATNLPLQDSFRHQLLALSTTVQRLRLLLSFLETCRVIVCRRCHKQLGDQAYIFSMSSEGPQGAFVNPGGVVHETLTLYRAKNLRLVGHPSAEYSWFPGYSWTITECGGCGSHIGWKFTSSTKKLNPIKFYGFSRRNIEAKTEVPVGGEDGDRDSNVIHVM